MVISLQLYIFLFATHGCCFQLWRATSSELIGDARKGFAGMVFSFTIALDVASAFFPRTQIPLVCAVVVFLVGGLTAEMVFHWKCLVV